MLDKKPTIYILIALLFTSSFVKSYDNDDFLFDTNDDEYFLDDFDAFADDFDWDKSSETTRASDCIGPEDVLNIITEEPILLQNLLQENLYKRTNPINQRSLLDMPNFVLYQCCVPPFSDWQFNTWLFYNQTSKGNYTKEGTTIESYLDLGNANILQAIDELGLDVDIPSAVDLFTVLKIQERRTGLMLDFFHHKQKWNFEFKIPLYYYERNFFLNDMEVNRIKNSNFFDGNGDGTVTDSEIRRHVMNDKFGFGDSRFLVGRYVIDNENTLLNVGAGFTFPTAVTIANGLLGGKFGRDANAPPFSLLQLFQLAICDENLTAVQDMTIEFLIAAFDKLGANVLDWPMGNNGHFGLMMFTEKYLRLSHQFSFKSRASLEFLLPADENRFYILKKYPEEFNRDYSNPEDAGENLDFLNQQLINTLIPQVMNTRIWPGFIFRLMSAFNGRLGRTWESSIGYDIWWQDKEKLGKIKASPAVVSNLRTDIAEKSGAFQAKFFGSINYTKKMERCNWCLTFYIDKTFLRTGIGKDFNVSLRFGLDL